MSTAQRPQRGPKVHRNACRRVSRRWRRNQHREANSSAGIRPDPGQAVRRSDPSGSHRPKRLEARRSRAALPLARRWSRPRMSRSTREESCTARTWRTAVARDERSNIAIRPGIKIRIHLAGDKCAVLLDAGFYPDRRGVLAHRNKLFFPFEKDLDRTVGLQRQERSNRLQPKRTFRSEAAA